MASLTAADAVLLRSFGFNVVRLGVLWNAVYPGGATGPVNTSYLDAAVATVDMLAEHGIYTLVDMHQDAMSSYFCGEGFPDDVTRRALELAGFDAAGADRFPTPLKVRPRPRPRLPTPLCGLRRLAGPGERARWGTLMLR